MGRLNGWVWLEFWAGEVGFGRRCGAVRVDLLQPCFFSACECIKVVGRIFGHAKSRGLQHLRYDEKWCSANVSTLVERKGMVRRHHEA